MTTDKKERLSLRMRPDTARKIEQWYDADNCRSKNEFVEKAVNFYADYLAANDDNALLPTAILSAIDGRLGTFEKRSSALAFKQAVELDMAIGILADSYQLGEDYLRQLRSRAVRNVKQTNGRLTFAQRARETGAE